MSQIRGLKDLDDALKALPREIAGKNGGPLRTALRSAAVVIRNRAMELAPKETGRLSRAIVIRRDKTPAPVNERFVIKPRKGASRRDLRGAYYWHFVEFGTEKNPAQPFLRPAYDQTNQSALDTFKRRLAVGIKSAAKRSQRLSETRGR